MLNSRVVCASAYWWGVGLQRKSGVDPVFGFFVFEISVETKAFSGFAISPCGGIVIHACGATPRFLARGMSS